MSLFVRLWIMGTLIALAAGAIAIGAYIIVTDQQRLAQSHHEAFKIGRLISQAMAVGVFDEEEEDPVTLLKTRTAQFMAAGRLLSITVISPKLEVVLSRTLPSLENEEAWNELGPGPFRQIFDQPATNIYRHDDAFYVLAPLIDESGSARFVLAIGLPIQILELPDENRTLFVSLAISFSLLLGLIAARVLTGQVGQPIRLLTTTAERLEAGHFDTSVLTPLIGRRDEIGQLARTVLRLVQALDYLGALMERQTEAAQRTSKSGTGPP